MTNLVKATLYLAFGILGGFCLFWGNVAFFFVLIPAIALAFLPNRLTWWGLCTAAIGHGIGFGLMRGIWEGAVITFLAAMIYLTLWYWAFQNWKKKHPAATVTNAKR